MGEYFTKPICKILMLKGETGGVTEKQLNDAKNKLNNDFSSQINDVKKDVAKTVKSVNGITPDTNGAVEIEPATDEQVETSVNKWLTAHPEATTTVEDGSITEAKLESTFLKELKNPATSLILFQSLASIEEVLKNVVYKSKNTSAYDAFTKMVTAVKPEGAVSAIFNLTNCTIDNERPYYLTGDSYTGTVTINDNTDFDSITVTMGGTDITSTAVSGMTITISEITGAIVITAISKSRYYADGIARLNYVYSADSGDAYIDTGWQMTNLSEKMVLGFEYPSEMDADHKDYPFFGVNADSAVSPRKYSAIEAATWGDDVYKFRFGWFTYQPNNQLYRYDRGTENYSNQANYFSMTNGKQALYFDEDLTNQQPQSATENSQATVSVTDASKIPPFNVWLFRSNVQDVAYKSATKKTWRNPGIKIYCFKVYDADGNLEVNMRPAKRESDGAIGFYDTVRKQFFTNAATTGSLVGA